MLAENIAAADVRDAATPLLLEELLAERPSKRARPALLQCLHCAASAAAGSVGGHLAFCSSACSTAYYDDDDSKAVQQ